MPITLSKPSIDIGIVVSDGPRSLAFYRDLLGFKHIQSQVLPFGGGRLERLVCGDSQVKLLVPDNPPASRPARGEALNGLGFRYCTVQVQELDTIVKECEAVGCVFQRPLTEVQPGIRIAVVEDPDGNLVEFVENRVHPWRPHPLRDSKVGER
jgi:glyoxylase I family protein